MMADGFVFTAGPFGQRGGEGMTALNYLAEIDKGVAWNKYRPQIEDMNERQLRKVLILILDGEDIEKAFDFGFTLK